MFCILYSLYSLYTCSIRNAKQEHAIQFGILIQLGDTIDICSKWRKGERCFSRKLFPFYIDKLLSPIKKRINKKYSLAKEPKQQKWKKYILHIRKKGTHTDLDAYKRTIKTQNFYTQMYGIRSFLQYIFTRCQHNILR